MDNWFMVVLTLVIAILSYLIWKVYYQIEWLTGAMESHSEIMLRIEAKRGINGLPLKLIAWDPTIEPPPVKREHGQEIDFDTIYVYLPLSQRKNKPSWGKRIKELFQF
ncbi:MAG: hypothetical protein JW944_04765 [Deltaproteobacteria bacterium]|nr:hypothetical protein [Deltaproteobacteria bacterium]